MSYVVYDSLTLGTIAGIDTKLSSPEIGLGLTSSDPIIATKMQMALTDTKNTTLKNHLLMWLRDVMPDTISKWVNLRSAHFVRYKERFNLDTYPIYGMFTGQNGWFYEGIGTAISAGKIFSVQVPETYVTTTPPVNGTSGTLAGLARNGDRLIDTVTRKLYVNRETDDPPLSPVWDRQNYSDGLNYFINPSVLAQSHEYLAIARMFTLGVFQNRLGMFDPNNATFMYNGEQFWQSKFIGSLYGEYDDKGRVKIPGILKGLLQVDFSNDGDFGDFEREMAGEEHYGFV